MTYGEWMRKEFIKTAEILSKESERIKTAMHPLNEIRLDLGTFKFQPTIKIKNVIFNPPATIVFWNDGTKTVVKTQNEGYDAEKGLAMAVMRKILNNKDYHEYLAKAEDYQGMLDALNSMAER